MMILTLWVTGLGLLSSSSASTRAKWLSCQIGRPSRLSLDNYAETNMRTRRDPLRAGSHIGLYRGETDILSIQTRLSDTSSKESTPRCISVGVCEVDVAHPHLQDEGHARREEGHEDKVIGQDGHAAETTHDLQLGHAWKTTAEVMGVILPLSTPPRRSVRKEKRSPDTVPTPMTRHSTTASRVKVGPRMAMPSEMFSLTSSCTQDTRPPHPSPFLSINTQLISVHRHNAVCVCVCVT